MAKKRQPEPQQPASSRTTLIILLIGGLAVAALVVWALTRTVETPASEPAPVAATQPATNMPLTATQTQTAPPFPQAAPVESNASVPRMAVEDLREKWKAGSVTIIDVRDDASFAAGHIPSAMHIPLARVEGEMSSLPKQKQIVTYCT